MIMYNNFFSILLEKLLFYRYKDAERRYMRIDIPEGANKVIEGLHFFERRKYAIIKHMNLKYSFSEAF